MDTRSTRTDMQQASGADSIVWIKLAFPDFHAEIHWQAVDGDIVTTFKTYHGTHHGVVLGIEPTGRKVRFETVDAMRIRDGKIAEHWGVANLYYLLQQLDALPPSAPKIPEV